MILDCLHGSPFIFPSIHPSSCTSNTLKMKTFDLNMLIRVYCENVDLKGNNWFFSMCSRQTRWHMADTEWEYMFCYGCLMKVMMIILMMLIESSSSSAFDVIVALTRSSLPWVPLTWMSGTNPLQTPRARFWGTHKWAISAALLGGRVSRIAGIMVQDWGLCSALVMWWWWW